MIRPFVAKSLQILALSAASVCAGPAWTQPQTQNLPDAPSASRPPNVPQAPTNPTPEAPSQTSGDSSSTSQPNAPNSPPAQAPPGVAKPSGAPETPNQAAQPSQEEQGVYKLPPLVVNQVIVPVTVKDRSNRLVPGLLKNDFAVYEDGVPQTLNFFKSDPFPMAVAVVIDTGMSETTLRKVKAGLGALQGAFSPYDQVALYTYAGTVNKILDFTGVGDQLTAAIQKVQSRTGSQGGFTVAGGPMNAGPSVNGRPFDPGQAPSQIIPKENRVLNDALVAAALDLAQADKAKRRIIMVVSDGKESRSNTSYSDALKLLLSHEISVYAIGVDAAAIPLYRKLQTINVPGTYNANILPKYASATGGQVFPEFSRSSIDAAYANVTEEARNQYTLGYRSRSGVAGNYRQIEVRVHRPGLKIFAKDGYYPLPPQRQ